MNLFLDRMIEWVGRCVAWLVLFMALFTVVVVVLRYVFETGAILWQESVVYMHALVFMLGLSYALKHDAHVRVDLIYSRLSRRSQAIINLAGNVVFLIPTSLLIAYHSLDYVATSWSVLEGSQEVGGIPAVFLLKTLIPVASILLLVQSFLEIAACIRELRSS